MITLLHPQFPVSFLDLSGRQEKDPVRDQGLFFKVDNMLACAFQEKGDPIEMEYTLEKFPMKPTTVRQYAEKVEAGLLAGMS